MPEKYPFSALLLILTLAGLTACALVPAARTAIPQAVNTLPPSITTRPPTSSASNTLESPLIPTRTSNFTDAWAYCAAIGAIDAPDARYTGPKMPDAIVQGLRKASGAAADAPDEWFTNGSFWRCMDGKVVACTVGANLPCTSKANTDKTPTQAESDFCQANPDSVGIPASVTGHDTIYSWNCQKDIPVIDQQVFHVDARGFIAEIWYAIPPVGGQ
jgi:hypothetical protein